MLYGDTHPARLDWGIWVRPIPISEGVGCMSFAFYLY
jgi:hypothetical protein